MDLVFFLGFVIIKFRCGPQVMLIVSVNWFRLLPTLLSKTDHVKFQVSSPLGDFFNLLLLWNLNLIFNLLTFQGDEVTLAKAINLLHMNKDDYIAILFYASWCPFSQECKPNFETLASLFPNIHHFAFEESTIRPRYVHV
jgi:thiol-disulfide isomerase/thioredoxin